MFHRSNYPTPKRADPLRIPHDDAVSTDNAAPGEVGCATKFFCESIGAPEAKRHGEENERIMETPPRSQRLRGTTSVSFWTGRRRIIETL